METSEAEKIRLEHQAARLFMRRYEELTGKEIRHIWHNQPRRPDVSCYLENEKLDLEIAHLYGSEAEAMQILGRDLSPKTQAVLRELDCCSDPHVRLAQALNRILRNKAHKCYRSKKVWLVIRNAHPAWTTHEIKAVGTIEVPEQHPFEEIWIIGDMEAQTGILQLFPNGSS